MVRRGFLSLLLAGLGCLVGLSEGKTAAATFYFSGVQGFVKFSQAEASSAVQIDVNLTGLQQLASGYHIHQLPVNFGGSKFTLGSADEGCSASITAAHFNPLNVVGGAGNVGAGDYLCSTSAHELCEAGDISGKFGNLSSLTSLQATYQDSNSGLTLFGEDSIIGRSVVIHYSDSSRWVCATIFEENVDYKYLVATFDAVDFGVYGTVTLMHDSASTSGDTIVFSNLYLAEKAQEESIEFTWAIHDHSLFFRDATNLAEKCGLSSTGSQLADLTSLTQKLKLLRSSRTKNFFTLPNFASTLFGSDSSSGASIVLKGSVSGEEFVDCADFGKLAIATFDSTSDGIKGFFKFYQASPTENVQIEVVLSNLKNLANRFSINSLPVGTSCSSTSSSYNPFLVSGGSGVPGTYVCSSGDHSGCEVGDLSGRFGGLFGRDSASYTFLDGSTGLTLFGLHSVIGRSIAIYNIDGDQILACATILEQGKLTGFSTSFSDDDAELVGEITLTQRAVDPDADATIFVDLANDDVSENHMFHVHAKPVDPSLDNGVLCGSTAAHFSPTKINGGAGFATLPYLCSVSAPEFCEAGDLSGKIGKIGFPEKSVFTSSDVPLTGFATIAARSITVHDENSQSARIACSNLDVVNFPTPELPEVTETPTEEDSSSEGSVNVALIFAILLALVSVGLGLVALELRTQLLKSKLQLKQKYDL